MMLMVPEALSVRVTPAVPVIPPAKLSVVPASAPIVAPPGRMICPLTVLMPPKLCNAPAKPRPLPVSVRRSATAARPVAPLSCNAAPVRATVTPASVVPRALPLVMRTAPALIVSNPCHEFVPKVVGPPGGLAVLSAARTRMPLSPLMRGLASCELGRISCEFSVSVFPAVTSSVLPVAWARIICREVGNVPVARSAASEALLS